MVHGGGWWQGDKFDTPVVRNKVEAWVPTGAVFISVNYPLVPNADPLRQALSVAKALAYAQRNAAQWSADQDKFIVMGFSAGAHLVSLLAADSSLATSVGARERKSVVRGKSVSVRVYLGGRRRIKKNNQQH